MKTFAPAVLGTALFLGISTLSATANTGIASYYGPGFAGKKTASGERFNPNSMTCAHRSLPFGTHLKLTNLTNGATVVVRVNDRGPFIRGRELDVSHGAARALGMTGAGIARLNIETLNSHAEPKAATMRRPAKIAKAGKTVKTQVEAEIDWAERRREEIINRS